MCALYRDKQKRSHFESFANKIFTGIREIKPEYAEKRAIWELFQNALDTVAKEGVIEIKGTQKGLLFKHNGRPFKDDEVGGLIKQYSVGKAYGDNREKLGQYGTGFISTHVYGKKILINGSIQIDDGTYRTLVDFELDRDANTIEELTDKLLKQDEIIEALCDNQENAVHAPLDFISFEYQSIEPDKAGIDRMLAYVDSLLPFIFCFNDKLKEVRVGMNHYLRKACNKEVVQVGKNDLSINIPVLRNNEDDVRVILGMEDEMLRGVPKQFLFYPLMDTVAAGYNFIIHANDFKPNKERDYLHKNNQNQELKNDVATNKRLLGIAFDLAIQAMDKDEMLPFMQVSKLEFNEQDSDFEKELKVRYISAIDKLLRLKVPERVLSLRMVEYFDELILNLEEPARQAIYNVLSQFRALPPFENYCTLSKRVNNWNNYLEKKFKTLSSRDIACIVANEGSGNYFGILDKEAYKKFLSVIATNVTMLNDFALIPNIHGNFCHFEHLVKWETKETLLVEIIDSVNASASEKYIHDDFEFLKNVQNFNREKFKEDFSNFCNDISDQFIRDERVLKLSDVQFKMLQQRVTDFVALNKKSQLNIDVVRFYRRVFKLSIWEGELIDPTVGMNYQPAIKLLANLYMKSLADQEIRPHLADLRSIIAIMFKSINLKDELLHRLPCIPNQKLVLRPQAQLKKDDVVDEDFKNRYKTITGEEIRDFLAYEGFDEFLQHTGLVKGHDLGAEIETKLNSKREFIPVVPELVDTLLSLIEKISERPATWGQWLPNINGVKEEILMHKFRSEKTRSSLFSILTKDEKTIELLGDLAKIGDLEDFVKKGKEKQREENRKNNHLNYINYIGLTIQDLIKVQLDLGLAQVVSILKSVEDQELTTLDKQNGQDFIIYKNGQPVYFLEVKSKWDENGRFALTINQTERCAQEPDRYAVICVNVDRYKRQHAIDIENIPFEDLKEFVIVVDDLGPDFAKLINENLKKTELNDPKLIEFRGSIPQKVIDTRGIQFDQFLQQIIEKIKIA